MPHISEVFLAGYKMKVEDDLSGHAIVFVNNEVSYLSQNVSWRR